MTTLVDLSQDVNELTPGIIAPRRELHRHPDLAFEEVWTAATLLGTGSAAPSRPPQSCIWAGGSAPSCKRWKGGIPASNM